MLGIPNLKDIALNEFAKMEAQAMKMDMNKNGVSDLLEIKAALVEGLEELEELQKKFSPEDIAAAVEKLAPGKLTAEDIKKAEATVNKIAGAIMQAVALLQALSAMAKK